MAKPIGNGKGNGNSAQDRSWLVTVTELLNQGDGVEITDSNDFFYIDPDTDWNYSWDGNIEGYDSLDDYLEVFTAVLPDIDGGGGADQIIMMEDADIEDGFFALMQNVTVLKLGDGKDLTEEGYDPEGSTANLGFWAQEAGIREVTGGPGDDVIDFSDYEIQYETDENGELKEDEEGESIPIPLDIIIRGGAGADEMTGSDGNDTFIWKAGDLEGTNEDHPDYDPDTSDPLKFDTIIDFKQDGTDVLDISDLLIDFDCETYGTYTEDQKLDYLEKWISFDNSTGILSVDIDGEGVDFEFEALVELQGVTDLELLNDLIVC